MGRKLPDTELALCRRVDKLLHNLESHKVLGATWITGSTLQSEIPTGVGGIVGRR